MISDEEFDKETYREYEDQLYHEDSWSEEDMDCEIEEALYSQVHYASSLLVSETAVSGVKNTLEKTGDNDESVIKILSSDDEDDGTTVVSSLSSNSVAYPEVIHIYPSHHNISKNPELVLEENGAEEEEIVENWHLIKEDLEDAPKFKQHLRYHTRGIECYNCKGTGHVSYNCPVPKKVGVCYLCGVSGHERRKCPNELCFNCNEPGHISKQCQKPRARPFERCKRCHVKGHFAKDCPDRWRQYHLTRIWILKQRKTVRRDFQVWSREKWGTEVGPIVRPDHPQRPRSRRYCYNCGNGGHYGHECSEEIAVGRGKLYLPFVVQYDGCHNSAEDRKSTKGKSESRRQSEQRNKAERRNEQVTQPEYDHAQYSQDIHDFERDMLVTEPPSKEQKLGNNNRKVTIIKHTPENGKWEKSRKKKRNKGNRDEHSERVVEFRPSDQGLEEQYYHPRKRRAKQKKNRCQDGTYRILDRGFHLRNNNQMHGKNLHIIFDEHYTF